MKIKVLGAAGGEAPGLHLVSFLIDDVLLLDAGTIGNQLELSRQQKIQNILLTHSHLDHIHALPFLLDNLIGRISGPINVYGLPEVLEAVHTHLFNHKIWPDFTQLPTRQQPILKFCPMDPQQVLVINGFKIEIIRVNHSFAAAAYLISDEQGTVLFTGDTGASPELWEQVKHQSKLHALFIECSFSNRMQGMAQITKHMTPADVAGELKQLGLPVSAKVYLYHLKPEYMGEIAEEIKALQPMKIQIARTGDKYLVGG